MLIRNKNPLTLVGLILMTAAVLALVWSAGSAAQPSRPAAALVPTPQTLVVFVPASLQESMAEMGRQFEAQHPGVRVRFNLAGSQQLVQQLAHGAPGDVLVTASQKSMDQAVASGRVAPGAPAILARNRLVVIYPAGNPARLHRLSDLARPGVRLVLADGQVPAGQYSLEMLSRAVQDPALGPAFHDRVLANIVSYEENVRAVRVKVVLGEADAGIVYRTDAMAGQSDRLGTLEIPPPLNPVAVYWVAPVIDSPRANLAEDLVRLLVSARGQRILARHGFQSLEEAAVP